MEPCCSVATLVSLLVIVVLSASGGEAAKPAPTRPERITKLADLCLTTTLADDGQPQCAIVAPDKPLFRKLAKQVQARVRECCGATLPIRRDTESLDILSRSHAIAIGCLPNNKLVERLYLDWFSLCDRWYPGKGGWLIRTIHNPYGTGRNAIVLGASEDAMLASAVAALCKRLTPGRLCQVGRIWDIHLGKGMAFEPDVDRPGLFHPFTNKSQGPGLSKTFQQGLRYWYTGDEAYAKRFIRSVAANPAQIARGGHYAAHKHALIWDVIEESASFADEQRLKVVNAFVRHLRSKEALGAPAIKAWVDAKNPKRMMDRHAMMSALCALGDARYLQAHYPRKEFADALDLLDRYFARQMTHGKGWKDEVDLHTYLEMPLRYAIFRRNGTFAKSGALRLFADRCVQYCNNLGGPGTYPFHLLRMAGYVLGDPGCVHVANLYARAEQQHGPLGDHEFLKGQAFAGDLEPAPPKRHVGLFVTPVDPVEHWVYDYALPLGKGFDKITLRAGFGPDDDYILLDGITRADIKANYDAMGISEFSTRGRHVLVTLNNCTILDRSGFAHHNLVTVTRDGQAELPPLVGERVHSAHVGGIAYAHVRMDPYIASAYDRRLLWKPNRWLVVADRIRARRAGHYAIECRWQILGEGRQDGRSYRSTIKVGDSALDAHITCAQPHPLRVTRSKLAFSPGSGWTLGEFLGDLTRVRQVACGRLKKGESREFTNLITVGDTGRPRSLDIRAVQPGLDVMTGDENALLVSADTEWPKAKLTVKADAAVLTDSRVVLFAATEFAWHEAALRATAPIDVAWNLAKGTAEVAAEHEVALTISPSAKFTVDGKAVKGPVLRLAKGRHRLAGLRAPAPATLRADIAEASARAQAATPPAETARPAKALEPLWEAKLPAEVASLAVAAGKDGVQVFAGDSKGGVHALRNGKEAWTFRTKGLVGALAVGTLDGPEPALLVGSDDQHLYRLGLDGTEAWRCKMSRSGTCAWWTLDRKSKVKAILIDDLDGDGKGEIVVGHGGMKLELVDAAGTSRWNQLWHWAIPTTLAAVDVNGDGTKEIISGGWIRSCTSFVKSFSAAGKPIHGSLYGRGRASRGFDCAGVPFLAYFRKWKALRAVVARSGPFCDLGLYDHGSQKLLWQRIVGDTVSGLVLADLDGDKAPEIIYATEAGWVVAVDRAGKTLWARSLTDAVLALARVGSLLAAACEDGRVHFLDSRGKTKAIAHTPPGRPWLAPAELRGKPTLAVASGSRVALYQP